MTFKNKSPFEWSVIFLTKIWITRMLNLLRIILMQTSLRNNGLQVNSRIELKRNSGTGFDKALRDEKYRV